MICKSISICFESLYNIIVPSFYYGDIDQLDPYFAAFKRIKSVKMKNLISNDEIIIWIENMQLIRKALVRIDTFSTSKVNLEIINELYKDEHTNILIDRFELLYDSTKDILNEDAEVLNKIKPKILKIDKIS